MTCAHRLNRYLYAKEESKKPDETVTQIACRLSRHHSDNNRQVWTSDQQCD
jgi:hypothetical protein